MAKRIPLQLVIAAFQSEEAADGVEKAIAEAEFDSKQAIVTNMAVAKKDASGAMTVKELGHPSALQAAKAGGLVGGLLGGASMILLGPLGIAAGASAGGATGAALAHYGASQIEGMDKDKLAKFGNALEPGCSGAVLVFDEVIVSQADYQQAMTEYKESTDALLEQMSAKISENLKAGNAIAYHLAFGEDGMVGHRMIVGPDAAKIAEIVLTPEGLAAAEVSSTETSIRVNAAEVTPEGMAAARARLTSSVCAYEVAVATEDAAVYEAGAAHATAITE